MLSLLLALAGLLLANDPAARPTPLESVRVTLAIDFGRAERPRIEREIEIAAGSNVVDVTRAVAPVEQDRLCCSPEDVWSIDGIGPDVRHHAYWSWKLDGRSGPNFPAKYVVADGDRIEWIYGGSNRVQPSKHRVVSLLPAATDMVIAIGGETDLVGVCHLSAQPEGRSVPRVVSTPLDSDSLSMRAIDAAVREASAARESLYRLDDAGISALRPTVVLSQGVCPVCAVPAEQAEALASDESGRCASLVVLTPRTLADVAADIRRVGGALDRKNDAEVAARDFERRIEKVQRSVAGSLRPKIAVIEWFDPLWVSGEWIAEMVEVAGGTPVLVKPADPSRRVEFAELIAADPDILVLAACSMDVERARREISALTKQADWQKLRAVRGNRVFLLDGAHDFSSPGPGLARGVEVLAQIVRDPNGVVLPAASGERLE